MEEYRGLGGIAILFSEMENFEIDFYKLHRVYKKTII